MNVNFVFVFLQANQLHQLGYDVFIVTHNRYSKVHTYQKITTPGAAKEFSHKYENVFQLWKSYMNVKPNTTLTNSSTLSILALPVSLLPTLTVPRHRKMFPLTLTVPPSLLALPVSLLLQSLTVPQHRQQLLSSLPP